MDAWPILSFTQKGKADVDHKGNGDQHQPQGDAGGEHALARLQGNGGGDGAGMPLDVAAHHHGNPHLGHDASVSSQARCQQTEADFP
ncbi:hypothetical protein DESC_780126 [Desulfosarcina cetonica]|nr:hypothetical protein DESC_780126 [Desulfosarcina cetonica]